MNSKQVKVYTTPTCPWCKKVKQFLESNSVPFQELNVAENKAARDEMVNLTHQLAVPTITIDGDYIIGYNEKALKEKLGIK
ncbi:MAG: glutaredoxin family protein [Dehalococcoidales bacterium]|jgi:glutaredoxin-like YruB-family protein|nr:glutaredoxin family protein [Dehalococcoidales bacterium]